MLQGITSSRGLLATYHWYLEGLILWNSLCSTFVSTKVDYAVPTPNKNTTPLWLKIFSWYVKVVSIHHFLIYELSNLRLDSRFLRPLRYLTVLPNLVMSSYVWCCIQVHKNNTTICILGKTSLHKNTIFP